MVARLPLLMVCRAFPRLQAGSMVQDYVPPSKDSLKNIFTSLEIPSVMGVEVPIPARLRSTALLLQTLESRSQENNGQMRSHARKRFSPDCGTFRRPRPTNPLRSLRWGGVRVLTLEKLLPTSHTDVLPW
eukprot:2803342-Pleurochrysis_carterae.AAC.1